MRTWIRTIGIIVIALTLTSCSPVEVDQSKITIWHWMTDRKVAFQELAAKYKEQTGTEVEFKLFFPPDIYSQKVTAAARSNNLPDIFSILGEKKTVGSFIKADYILNLKPYMMENSSSWRKRFYPQALRLTTFEKDNAYGTPEGIYSAPIDTTIMQFVYNKTLFKKAGLNPNAPPKTFEDFLEYAKKAQDTENAVGFICGWGESWLINALATEWAINLMGEEKFLKTIKGEVPYTDQEWLEVFSLFAKLKDANILAPSIISITNKESENAFSKDKVFFSFNGSWAINAYKQLNPDLEYGFFSLPRASMAHPVKVWGGVGSSFMVNANSPRKEEAVALLQWLTTKEQQLFLATQTNNLPSIKGCERELSPLLQDMLGALNNLTHPNIWPVNEDSRVSEVFDLSLQQIVSGIKTPQEAAGKIQDKKEKVSK